MAGNKPRSRGTLSSCRWPASPDDVRMIPRIAERIEAHERIHHGREDAAQPILAIEPLPDERYAFSIA